MDAIHAFFFWVKVLIVLTKISKVWMKKDTVINDKFLTKLVIVSTHASSL